MYGQTEATARMSYLPAKDAIRKCGSMGIAIPGGKFRIMEDASTEIKEPDTVGELVYSGPNVTMGYAECAADLEKEQEARRCSVYRRYGKARCRGILLYYRTEKTVFEDVWKARQYGRDRGNFFFGR